MPTGIVPRIRMRLSQQTWAIGKWWLGAQLTGIRVPFDAFGTHFRPADPEQIRIAVDEPRHKACPCSVSQGKQAMCRIGHPSGPMAARVGIGHHIDVACSRSPRAEGRSSSRQERGPIGCPVQLSEASESRSRRDAAGR